MRKFVYDCWNAIMDHKVNPLRHIPDLQVRHMVMQILAFMWSAVFSVMIANSYFAFAVSGAIHIAFILAVVITVATFKVAKDSPQAFDYLKSRKNYD